MTSDSADGVVVTRNVWKIFGERADEAMAACRRENLSRAEWVANNMDTVNEWIN